MQTLKTQSQPIIFFLACPIERDYYKPGRGVEKCAKNEMVPALKPGYTKHRPSPVLLIDLKPEFWLPLCGAVGCSMISIPLCRVYAYHMLSRGHEVMIH